jgi:hypothetical protein
VDDTLLELVDVENGFSQSHVLARGPLVSAHHLPGWRTWAPRSNIAHALQVARKITFQNMPAPHIFALAHSQLDDFVIPEASSGRPPRRKRKASEARDTTEKEDNYGTTSTASQLNGLSQDTIAFTSLTAEEHQQLRTAGLQPGEEIPSIPFPHKRPATRGYVLRDVRKELQDLSPPLVHLDPNYYAPQPLKSNRERTTLREQHVAVLTTLLHQMLQKGDYKRAGRAWALLLRSGNLTRDIQDRQGIAGMDLRTHERWGIGAELLMRKQPMHSADFNYSGGYLDYSNEGFRLARQYYERLIVQYPADPRRKGAQASTFYAAMFSLWIYEVNRHYKNGTPAPGRRTVASPSPLGSENSERSGSASLSFNQTSSADEEDEEDSVDPQLQDVKAIAKRMDDVLENPPHDKNGELLQMRGMLELWIADLANLVGKDTERSMTTAASLFSRAQRNGMELTEHALRIVRDHGDEYLEDEDEDEAMDDDSGSPG